MFRPWVWDGDREVRGRRGTQGLGKGVWSREWLEGREWETTIGPGGKNWGGRTGPGESTTGVRFWHLLEQCVVGAVQVELAKVVPVGKDEKWFLVCRGRVLTQLLA